jgi:sugar/nucleoside kinase (ribokinase family)
MPLGRSIGLGLAVVAATAVALLSYSMYSTKRKQRRDRKSIAVIGLVCLDIHAHPVKSLPERGNVIFGNIHISAAGTAGGVAVTASKLDLFVDLYGCVGGDYVATILLSLLERVGIDVTNVQRLDVLKTSCTVINVGPSGERPALHQKGAADHLVLEDYDSIYTNNEIIHIGGIGLVPNGPYLKSLVSFLQARDSQRTAVEITLDLIAPYMGICNDLVTILPYIDYFMPSVEEAEEISRLKGAARNGEYFLGIGVRKACIFKAGAAGSWLVTRRDSPIDLAMRTGCRTNERVIAHTNITGSVSTYHILAFDVSQIASGSAVVDTT